jgi:hypothetical protein
MLDPIRKAWTAVILQHLKRKSRIREWWYLNRLNPLSKKVDNHCSSVTQMPTSKNTDHPSLQLSDRQQSNTFHRYSVNQSVNQPVSQPASQPASHSASQSVSQPVSQSASHSASQPVSQSAS